MIHSNLIDLIKAIELGTNVHISVLFFGNYGNMKTALPFEHTIHPKPICRAMKQTLKGERKCIMCRNLSVKKVFETKKSFSGLCINGVFEYVRPIIEQEEVVAIIFIGNIVEKNHQKLSARLENANVTDIISTMQKNYSIADCILIGNIIENHIRSLIKEYGKQKSTFNPLIENIKNYLKENYILNISASDISNVFSYNKKYLGQIFKKETGTTISAYINRLRLEKAKYLITTTAFTIIEISMYSGFNNVTYFNRIFKNFYGVSPTGYRKNYSEINS